MAADGDWVFLGDQAGGCPSDEAAKREKERESKAGHESGSSTSTHEYTCGNTCE